jgi:hypothetical protein
MKLAILSLAVASAAAFTTSGSSRASTKLNGAMEDLKAVAEKSNPVLKVCVLFPDFAFLHVQERYLTSSFFV